MEPFTLVLLLAVAVLSAGGAYVYGNSKKSSPKTEDNVPAVQPEIADQQIVVEARSKAKDIVLEARQKAMDIESAAKEKAQELRESLSDKEKEVAVKKAEVDSKERDIASKARSLKELKEKIEKQKEEIDELVAQQRQKLEKVASLSEREAKELLLGSFEKDLAAEKGKRIRLMEEELKRNIDEKARQMLVEAMRYGATDYVVEYTTSRVKLPEEDIKGRIIGKEGRNIKMFEELTGVELDLDSSPGEVIISSFDPVRREVAKVALERLIKDGRIQPARIEEVVEKTEKEIQQIMYKEGDNLCHRVGVYDLPKDIVQMLGKFKYRFSYGQNMIEHTLEETRMGVAIASELGVDVETVKLGCLLHDIGKVVSDEEGTHVQLGVELLKKYKIDERVVNCVAEHHEDRPFSSIESAVVNLADHISGARPGARSEDYDSYVQRMQNLEDAATSFEGVGKAHAVSAGREVRVFVSPEKVDDDSTALLAREIAKKIELEQTYPGVVKVTVIRETRFTETAK